MTPVQIAAVMMVGSGATHAVVNAILKSGKDKMASRALIDGFSAILVAPFAFFLPLPHGAWGWLAASGATHLVYLICLVKAFETADFSVAYPVMRGIAPVLAAAVSVTVFREPLAWLTAVGIGLVSLGVITTSLGRRGPQDLDVGRRHGRDHRDVHTVIDAQGVRAAPSAISYIAWVFLSLGLGIAALSPRSGAARRSWSRRAANGGPASPPGASRSSPTAWRCGRSVWATRRAWRRSGKPRSCSPP